MSASRSQSALAHIESWSAIKGTAVEYYWLLLQRMSYLSTPTMKAIWLIRMTVHACLGCGAGAGGCGLKHCSRNAVYMMKAIDSAIRAYMNMFSSGCLNRFFRSQSRTSSSDSKSPLYMLGKRFLKYTMAGSLVTPHLRAYRGSCILTNVMSKLSVSLSMFSSLSITARLSGDFS